MRTIQKRSTIPGKVPAATDLKSGELAINFPDKKVYSKDNNGQVIVLSEPQKVTSVQGMIGDVMIPPATETELGLVKQGNNIYIEPDGTINALQPTMHWDGGTVGETPDLIYLMFGIDGGNADGTWD